MPFDPNQLPTWNKEGVEPPQSLKDSGWQPSQKPPADWFNWFFNKTYNALKSLFTNAQHKEEKGQPNGYASLDENAKVPTSQLPIATTTSPGAISASDKAKLDGIAPGAEVNQNAFTNVKVGTTTIAADSKTDTLELVAGQNIVLTPDAANDKVTIDVTGVAQAGHTHAFSEITNKPTTVDGYGITDAVKTSDVVTSPTPNKILKLDANGKLPASITGNADGNAATASKLQAARTISLSGDVTGSTSFDGSTNVSINATLANSGVTPGTYPKVTVDSKGRVTAGQSLSASDIPGLDWSKITSGKPTTLSGYGITDGVNAFSLPRNGASTSWVKIAELTTNIGMGENGLILYVNGVSDFGNNLPGIDILQVSTRGSVGLNVYRLIPAGTNDITYGYVNNRTTEKTEIWLKRDAYNYAVNIIVGKNTGATVGNLLTQGTEPSGIVYATKQNIALTTDNVASASKLQTARTISLTGDVSGSASFDGSANASISATLANSGVTPGTYPKVTVDAKGRVTSGSSLSASDIPNLDWSKITSGKPTTLAGYGITDAIPASQKGAPNGVATLDASGKVPKTQLPNVLNDIEILYWMGAI